MYDVVWVKGDYRDRQLQANSLGCVCYVEAHFNALGQDDPDTQRDNPALCIVGANASTTSRNWAKWYTSAIAEEFGIRNGGILVGPRRGDFNLRYTSMPAVLLEPLFCSDATQAGIIKSADGQNRLARILTDSIRRFFPNGGKVAFSVGHKYKDSNPNDRGARILGGGWEAEYAEEVLYKAQGMISGGIDVSGNDRVVRVIVGGVTVQDFKVEPDADVRWNQATDTLTIGCGGIEGT